MITVFGYVVGWVELDDELNDKVLVREADEYTANIRVDSCLAPFGGGAEVLEVPWKHVTGIVDDMQEHDGYGRPHPIYGTCAIGGRGDELCCRNETDGSRVWIACEIRRERGQRHGR